MYGTQVWEFSELLTIFDLFPKEMNWMLSILFSTSKVFLMSAALYILHQFCHTYKVGAQGCNHQSFFLSIAVVKGGEIKKVLASQ
jgi:hypothetical protein